ncbi:MAG TPA: glycogen/starch synthase [Candidatus Limnocylindrales bacterium]|nr:glycogen/starch synthase [Candidatus Limnocylindrales bacterium]
MNILFVSAEVAPFVSIGGLSQVMYFLPKALRKLGHDVRIFTPKYGTMDDSSPQKKWNLSTEFSQLVLPVENAPDTGQTLICNVLSFKDKKNKVDTYFLENREYYELRANVYGYKDDHIRFALLSKGVLEWLYQTREKTNWWPDIIHCNDWHTGYLIDFARRTPRYAEMFKNTSIVYTVHNFSHQGNYDFKYGTKEDYDDGKCNLYPILSPKFQSQNPLKRGLIYADAISTVSQTHAVEVTTPEYAEGLDDVLSTVRGKLTGILNGLDTEKFNPMKDLNIKKKFDSHSFISAREINKKDLQKIFKLPIDATRPLLAFSGRLVDQKGLDMILEVLPHLFKERPDVQMVILGTGVDRYRLELTVLQKKFPDQVALHLRPDFKLPRKIFAGADMMLIPSIFEPGGIIALEAIRYGCVPIVRRTGGLNDIVTDFNPNVGSGNGFSFNRIDSWALYGAIIQALTIYNAPVLWKELVKNCMLSEFSWDHAAVEYDKWYKSVVSNKNTT